MTIIVKAAGRTHIGLVRRRNEDALHVGEHLVAVADGLGGHVAGDVASTTAMDAVRGYDRPVDPAELADRAGRAVADASTALHHRIAEDPGLRGMGTTLVALLWSGNTAALAHIGDSRAYLLRDGELAQVTEDHTFGHLVAGAGRVPTLPGRLSRFLNGQEGRSADITTHTLRPGDRYLLCSDGLSSYVPHRQVRDTLVAATTVGESADRLVAAALEAGGRDNITVAVVDVAGHPAAGLAQ